MDQYKLVNYIMAYESGELEDQKVLELFSHLIKSGQAWSLQGMYGRAAHSMIDNGIISETGEILVHPEELQ